MTEVEKVLTTMLSEVQAIRKDIQRIRYHSNDNNRNCIDKVYEYPDDIPETLTNETSTYFRTPRGIKTIPCMVVDMREANYEFSACKITEVPAVYYQFCLTYDSITDKINKKAASNEPKAWTTGKSPYSFSSPNIHICTTAYSGFPPVYTVINSEGKVRRFTKKDVRDIENSLIKANIMLPVKPSSYDPDSSDEVYLLQLITLYEKNIKNTVTGDDLLNNKEDKRND